MDAQTVKQNTDLIRLAEQAGAKFRRAGRVWQSACPLHGGDNPTAFTVFTGDDGLLHFKCFTRSECNEHGSDVIAFVQVRDGCDFKTALKTLGGEESTPARDVAPSAAPRPAPKPALALPDVDWQDNAWRIVDEACERLTSPDGKLGQEMLLKRCIYPATWSAWNIGFMWAFDPRAGEKRPSVIIPWWDVDDDGYIITAVKYRFIDGLASEDKSRRFGQRKGSVPILFGTNYATPGNDTLLLLEGEFNALSVWQLQLPRVACLSFGSQGGGKPEILQALATRYRRVVIWCDDPELARKYQAIIPESDALQSPIIEGVKWDANQMLQVGCLFDFIAGALLTKAQL
jgi:hypothetical protein